MKPRFAAFLFAVALLSYPVFSAQAPVAAPAAPAVLSIAVTGDVPTPLTITASDMASMPRVSAEVSEEDGQKVTYEGVSLQQILKKAGVAFGHDMRGKALASYVLAEAHDGYAVAFSMGELDDSFGATKIIVADKRDGKPLFGYQGPARLVVPSDKAGARSVRMLDKLEVVKLRK